ncbi:hypothetical protein PHYSODRAFT_517041 [Phytophthora sojae]|uniref:Uncharacterized protein n=1 Tax=Phytophthora sojae (strain P6497) TaxID=1094619 RepID=G4ZY56_PHYSP|nr:hypothetical protein PHYSODRAFT_517041 [Phytophthora sojae]EGZ11962.1 hypothetical protein PHYSODRAFT_517041 [Phytophthora sojae]|eukprot:XP_009532295.1 hypothetical protein PHYSODRAFT_517041 [Phytophthora sojae]
MFYRYVVSSIPAAPYLFQQFASLMGMDARMHIDPLAGSPRPPPMMTPPRRVEPVHQYFAAQHQGIGDPNTRQKKLTIRPFNGKELYMGLGSGFLNWDKRFERQILLLQAACGFT